MQTKRFKIVFTLTLLLATFSFHLTAHAQGTVFTYQGRLQDGPNAATGVYDLRFAIYDAGSGGAQQGNTITNSVTVVSNGLFIVTLDFGNQFSGANRWLEIAVRTNGASSFATLNNRQQFTPTPYAIFAENATALANGVALGMGEGNFILPGADDSFIGGGKSNSVGGLLAAVGGGNLNSAAANWSFIGGGVGNTTTATYAAVCGGALNTANGFYAMIGAGYGNTADGSYAMVPGGFFNVAAGLGSFAAGIRAHALHDGSFVWADSRGTIFSSTAADQFLIRAAGGVGIGTTNPVAPLHVQDRNASGESLVLGVNPHTGGYTALSLGLSATTGGYAWIQAIKNSGSTFGDLVLNPSSGNVGIGNSAPGALLQVGAATCNGSTWQNASDRALKNNFRSVDVTRLLEKVVALPISQWSYRTEAGVSHVGPTAQDFHTAFGLNGTDDKHIATVDADGVALAAVQGLNKKLEEKDARIAELERRLEKLEQFVKSKSGEAK